MILPRICACPFVERQHLGLPDRGLLPVCSRCLGLSVPAAVIDAVRAHRADRRRRGLPII